MTDDPRRHPDEAGEEAADPAAPAGGDPGRAHDRPQAGREGGDAEPPPDPDAPTDDVWEGNTLKEAAPGD